MTQSIRELLFWGLFWLAPMVLTVTATFFFLSMPARRNERARLFLDLLETGSQRGEAPERTILAISETHDRSVSVYYHLLAAHIEEGARLSEALEKTPRLLPASLAEVVKIGASENSLPRLLPAARAMLNDMNSRLRGAVNYAVVFLLVIVPAGMVMLPAFSTFIWPRFKQVMEDMETPVPAFSAMVFEDVGLVTGIEVVLLAFLVFIAFVYVGGPRVKSFLRFVAPRFFLDGLLLALPWRRQRMQRDFTGVLAILLDAGVPEVRAVELAGRAPANAIFEERSQRVVTALREGTSLPEALRFIERDEQFQWRWKNALRGGLGFFATLRGWHEALEARAFQQEQAAAHAITSSIVIINGVLVGIIAAAIFVALLSILDTAVLW